MFNLPWKNMNPFEPCGSQTVLQQVYQKDTISRISEIHYSKNNSLGLNWHLFLLAVL